MMLRSMRRSRESSPRWSISSRSSASSATCLVITPSAVHLRKIAHAAKHAVGDTRRAAAAAGDLLRPVVLNA